MNILPKFFSHLIDIVKAKCLINFRLRGYRDEIYSKVRMSDIKKIFSSTYFAAKYYKETYNLDLNDLCLAAHYTYIGFKHGYNPSPFFSNDGYYCLRPDVRIHGINPLLHYLNDGFREGIKPITVSCFNEMRTSDPEIEEIKKIRKEKKIVLLLSHEMSLTGAPRALLNLAIILKRNGIEPVLATLFPGDLQAEVKRAGIIGKLLPMQCMNQDIAFSAKISEYISLFDLILFNTIVALPLVDNIKSLTIPKICWLHDGSYGFKGSPSSSRFASLYPLFDKIFVVGDYAKKIACSYGEKNIEMENLNYGIDDSHCEYQEQKEHDSVTMILAGSIEKRKGQDTLLDCLPLLGSDIIKQLKIYIIGGTIDTDIYCRLKNSKFNCLELLGVVPHEQVMSYFKKMDILLCPSLDDPMPIVCTEAMMLSKPIIVSDHTGTASFVDEGKNGYIVQAGVPESLAEAITKAVKAKSELPSMGKRARRVYEENFTNEIFEKNIKEKILSLL